MLRSAIYDVLLMICAFLLPLITANGLIQSRRAEPWAEIVGDTELPAFPSQNVDSSTLVEEVVVGGESLAGSKAELEKRLLVASGAGNVQKPPQTIAVKLGGAPGVTMASQKTIGISVASGQPNAAPPNQAPPSSAQNSPPAVAGQGQGQPPKPQSTQGQIPQAQSMTPQSTQGQSPQAQSTGLQSLKPQATQGQIPQGQPSPKPQATQGQPAQGQGQGQSSSPVNIPVILGPVNKREALSSEAYSLGPEKKALGIAGGQPQPIQPTIGVRVGGGGASAQQAGTQGTGVTNGLAPSAPRPTAGPEAQAVGGTPQQGQLGQDFAGALGPTATLVANGGNGAAGQSPQAGGVRGTITVTVGASGGNAGAQATSKAGQQGQQGQQGVAGAIPGTVSIKPAGQAGTGNAGQPLPKASNGGNTGAAGAPAAITIRPGAPNGSNAGAAPTGNGGNSGAGRAGATVTIRPGGAAAPSAGQPAPNGGNGNAGALPQGIAGAEGAQACNCNCQCPAGSFQMGNAVPAVAPMNPPPAAAGGPPTNGVGTSMIAPGVPAPLAAPPRSMTTVASPSPAGAVPPVQPSPNPANGFAGQSSAPPAPAASTNVPALAAMQPGQAVQGQLTVSGGSIVPLQSAVTVPLLGKWYHIGPVEMKEDMMY